MIWTKLLLAGFSNRVWLVGDILGKMAKTAWELQNQHFWCKFERGGGGGVDKPISWVVGDPPIFVFIFWLYGGLNHLSFLFLFFVAIWILQLLTDID